MVLISSISGIRGTLGGKPGQGLTPIDIAKFTSAFAWWAKTRQKHGRSNYVMVVGRDARISGVLVNSLVCSTLQMLGIDVVNAGLATTPTVEMAVKKVEAIGGIIITASHNPKEWNALKLLNCEGEFISADEGQEVVELIEAEAFCYSELPALGKIREESFLAAHIGSILELPMVNKKAIGDREFTVAVDGVNSVGGVAVPVLLKALEVNSIHLINEVPLGDFAHNPEPLPENLSDLAKKVVEVEADLGIAVDPDVDRLALICEDGSFFGEENTLVATADYVLSMQPGNTVSNLSSSKALQVLTEKKGGQYYASAVGEVNVVSEMKRVNAVIGGEGNGGVIFPALHYGRDALVGIALVLSHLASNNLTLKDLKKRLPQFYMAKRKISLPNQIVLIEILMQLTSRYDNFTHTLIDGLRIDFEDRWVHIRGSNTEPIVRIYSEAPDSDSAHRLAEDFVTQMLDIVKNC